MPTLREGLAAGTSTLLLLLATLSHAAEESAASSGLAEIVVTAEKRAEKLSETPLSITALSSESLEQLGTKFQDFANTVPGLTFTTLGAGQSQVNLRGVTTGIDISPTVAIYVDEVPYGSSSALTNIAQLALDVGLFDIERVEVLRGPQGTLYGASTMGGLIKYVTVAPDTHAFSGGARAGFSVTESGGVSYDVASGVNLPLSPDVAAVRFSGFYTHDGGVYDNLARGTDNVDRSKTYGGRLDFLLKPIDGLSIRLNAFMQDLFREGTASADYSMVNGRPIDGRYDQRRLTDEEFEQTFRLVSATATYDFGAATLTSISSYQAVRSTNGSDLSALYVPLLAIAAGLDTGAVGLTQVSKTQKATEELRLAGTGEHLDWLVGGFFTRENSALYQTAPIFDAAGVLLPIDLITVTIPSRYAEDAGFATLTWHATPKLDASLGLRFAHNAQHDIQYGQGILIGSLPPRDSNGNIVTYLGNLRYRATDNVMAYLRFATGYRPGGPNVVANDADGTPLASPEFAADRLKSYEVGVKASTSDRRYSADLAVYFIDWDNLQIQTTQNAIGILANAASAKNKGAELTLTAMPIPALTVAGAFSYMNARLSGDSPEDLGAFKGDRLPNTPHFTGSLAADYHFPIAGLNSFTGASLRHISSRYSSFPISSGNPNFNLPAYTTFDVRGGVDFGQTRVQLYARNLFNSHGELSAFTALTLLGGPAEVSLVQPRTIGISLSTKF